MAHLRRISFVFLATVLLENPAFPFSFSARPSWQGSMNVSVSCPSTDPASQPGLQNNDGSLSAPNLTEAPHQFDFEGCADLGSGCHQGGLNASAHAEGATPSPGTLTDANIRDGRANVDTLSVLVDTNGDHVPEPFPAATYHATDPNYFLRSNHSPGTKYARLQVTGPEQESWMKLSALVGPGEQGKVKFWLQQAQVVLWDVASDRPLSANEYALTLKIKRGSGEETTEHLEPSGPCERKGWYELNASGLIPQRVRYYKPELIRPAMLVCPYGGRQIEKGIPDGKSPNVEFTWSLSTKGKSFHNPASSLGNACEVPANPVGCMSDTNCGNSQRCDCGPNGCGNGANGMCRNTGQPGECPDFAPYAVVSIDGIEVDAPQPNVSEPELKCDRYATRTHGSVQCRLANPPVGQGPNGSVGQSPSRPYDGVSFRIKKPDGSYEVVTPTGEEPLTYSPTMAGKYAVDVLFKKTQGNISYVYGRSARKAVIMVGDMVTTPQVARISETSAIVFRGELPLNVANANCFPKEGTIYQVYRRNTLEDDLPGSLVPMVGGDDIDLGVLDVQVPAGINPYYAIKRSFNGRGEWSEWAQIGEWHPTSVQVSIDHFPYLVTLGGLGSQFPSTVTITPTTVNTANSAVTLKVLREENPAGLPNTFLGFAAAGSPTYSTMVTVTANSGASSVLFMNHVGCDQNQTCFPLPTYSGVPLSQTFWVVTGDLAGLDYPTLQKVIRKFVIGTNGNPIDKFARCSSETLGGVAPFVSNHKALCECEFEGDKFLCPSANFGANVSSIFGVTVPTFEETWEKAVVDFYDPYDEDGAIFSIYGLFNSPNWKEWVDAHRATRFPHAGPSFPNLTLTILPTTDIETRRGFALAMATNDAMNWLLFDRDRATAGRYQNLFHTGSRLDLDWLNAIDALMNQANFSGLREEEVGNPRVMTDEILFVTTLQRLSDDLRTSYTKILGYPSDFAAQLINYDLFLEELNDLALQNLLPGEFLPPWPGEEATPSCGNVSKKLVSHDEFIYTGPIVDGLIPCDPPPPETTCDDLIPHSTDPEGNSQYHIKGYLDRVSGWLRNYQSQRSTRFQANFTNALEEAYANGQVSFATLSDASGETYLSIEGERPTFGGVQLTYHTPRILLNSDLYCYKRGSEGVTTLIHEGAHYVHNKEVLDPNIEKLSFWALNRYLDYKSAMMRYHLWTEYRAYRLEECSSGRRSALCDDKVKWLGWRFLSSNNDKNAMYRLYMQWWEKAGLCDHNALVHYRNGRGKCLSVYDLDWVPWEWEVPPDRQKNFPGVAGPDLCSPFTTSNWNWRGHATCDNLP